MHLPLGVSVSKGSVNIVCVSVDRQRIELYKLYKLGQWLPLDISCHLFREVLSWNCLAAASVAQHFWNFVHGYAGCTVYNLGTGKGTSVLEMVAAFEKAAQMVHIST